MKFLYRMTLAAAASFVSSVFATLAAVWSIQDRLYARDHNLAAEKNTHIIEHEMRQIESDDCFADWMQAFKITMHCSVLVVSCLAVVSNMMILLIQASVLLNSKQCSLQGAVNIFKVTISCNS